MEDDLKILKVEYLSNLLLDHTQIHTQAEKNHILQIIKTKMTSDGIWPQTIKWNIPATSYWIILKF